MIQFAPSLHPIVSRRLIGISCLLLLGLGSGCAADPAVSAASAAESSTPAPGTTAYSAEAVHRAALTIDAHADVEIPGSPSAYVGADGRSRVEPAKMQAGGLDAAVMAIAVGPLPRTTEGYATARGIAERKLAAVRALAADPANQVQIPETADQLVAAHRAGRSSLILGFQNALILGRDVQAINHYYDEGVRVFALTHMGHNEFADSSRPLFNGATGQREPDAEHGGLSPLGVAAIARLNALGAIVDVSQLSKQATLQVLNLSTAPIIASHSNAQALSGVSRNLSDEEIDLIGANGGVIHLAPFRGYLFDSTNTQLDAAIRSARRTAGLTEDYLYPFDLYWELKDAEVKARFLNEVSDLLSAIDLKVMIDHLDYIVGRIGVEHVGIGTDFNHGSGIPGYEDASDALNVTIELQRRGYSAEDIEKIWGGNFLRVWRAAERAALTAQAQPLAS